MSDVRTVATDALETLGTLISEKEHRDAIHLGVEPVVAGEILKAGDHVGLEGNIAFKRSKNLGIVDPFLTQRLKKGDRFWLVVYPRQITSLRHVWAHPDFPESVGAMSLAPEESKKRQAFEWIKSYASTIGLGHRELMVAAEEYELSGEYLSRGGLLEGIQLHLDFWDHYELVTGSKATKRDSFFTCSC